MTENASNVGPGIEGVRLARRVATSHERALLQTLRRWTIRRARQDGRGSRHGASGDSLCSSRSCDKTASTSRVEEEHVVKDFSVRKGAELVQLGKGREHDLVCRLVSSEAISGTYLVSTDLKRDSFRRLGGALAVQFRGQARHVARGIGRVDVAVAIKDDHESAQHPIVVLAMPASLKASGVLSQTCGICGGCSAEEEEVDEKGCKAHVESVFFVLMSRYYEQTMNAIRNHPRQRLVTESRMMREKLIRGCLSILAESPTTESGCRPANARDHVVNRPASCASRLIRVNRSKRR